ncbi:hypothetical protein [Pseudonocardia sp. TRM90224]|uniref:hypothetical protein n=1 Tax=Pseudonocardia sp. TRM90224 TaxID=2812678 RepID=UPI001E65AC44|nr:hypothetical protein [Pseudonocardia sp. TRM90224]
MTVVAQPVRRKAGPRVVVLAVGVVLGLLLGYLAVVGVLRSRELVLPAPTGTHAVGRTITTVGAEPRRAVWIWYPAEPAAAAAAPVAVYVPDGWFGTLPPPVGLGWLVQDVGAVRARAALNPAPAAGRFPAVVLAPGYESAPWMYTTIAEELASRGHVVAMVVPESTPARVVDGRRLTSTSSAAPEPARFDAMMEAGAADVLAVLDELAGNADTSRVVFAGHSLGGGAAVLACAREPRCVGSINVDGPQPDLPAGATAKPELLLGSERSCAVRSPCAADDLPPGYADWYAARREHTPASAVATIAGAGHNAFGDAAAYFVAPPLTGAMGTGTITAERMDAVQRAVLPSTVDQLLRGTAVELPHLPELTAS